ncbi:MAG: Gfo/Idh/MocA family oxidoreductase [Planctomycetes bacterium]|nr:Gfo/Idh/MocA family oxidoreductase [Planctomycetota bacterium]
MAVRLGVIGVGHLGKEHARVCASLPGAALAAVCDASRPRAEEIASKWKAPAFSDWRELPGRVDAVIVATPTQFHREVAQHFLGSGIPCLVEKPLAGTVEDCGHLVELAVRKGVALQVGHIERFNPAWTVARPLMGRVRFVQAERVSPYPFRSIDIDVTLDLMIHDIDLVLALTGAPLARLDASGTRVLSPTNDLVSARFAFEDGLVASVTASRVSPEPARRFRTFSEEAFVSIDLRGRAVSRVTKSEKLRGGFDVASVDPSKVASVKELLYGELLRTETPAVPAGEPLAIEDAAFVEAVRDRRAPPVTGEDGLRAVRVAHQVLEAVRGAARA